MKLKVLVLSVVVLLVIVVTSRLTGFRLIDSDPEVVGKRLLAQADIVVGGDRPWDIQVHNPDFYARVLAKGSLGLGESYMDGWWDCASLDQFFYKLLSSKVYKAVGINWDVIISYIRSAVSNLQSPARAFQVGEQHYDLGNDLFMRMLDKHMAYSCAYWKNAHNLEQAQEAKLKLICDKLLLKPGMHVLEIGCGWGSFARYAAKNYGVSVLGLTISKEQAQYAQELCKDLPVEIRLQDYRQAHEQCDRIVSIGMFEHVGHKNYADFMAILNRCLKPDGLILLHTIGAHITSSVADPWITKYIFPNGILPSIKQIAHSCEDIFIIEDVHNFGADYDTTLMAWFERFDASWHTLKDNYSDRFYRMWKYYLLACAGMFRAREAQLWQLVLSKSGVPGGYRCPR
jgi:cyclopropane-fatty-acyl-phospholipid synthase